MRRVVIESPFQARTPTAEDMKSMQKIVLSLDGETLAETANLAKWRAQQVEENLTYLRACMHDSLVNWDEAPYASHGLYTQAGVLDDDIPKERELGIFAGFAWRGVADKTVIYVDRGISTGMQFGIKDAKEKKRGFVYRAFLDGTQRCSFTLVIEEQSSGVMVDALALPGGCVVRATLDEALAVLREIAVEERERRDARRQQAEDGALGDGSSPQGT